MLLTSIKLPWSLDRVLSWSLFRKFSTIMEPMNVYQGVALSQTKIRYVYQMELFLTKAKLERLRKITKYKGNRQRQRQNAIIYD